MNIAVISLVKIPLYMPPCDYILFGWGFILEGGCFLTSQEEIHIFRESAARVDSIYAVKADSLDRGVVLFEDGTLKSVNINVAGESGLARLPGIGPVLAARIAAYRDMHGNFKESRDLIEIRGIGEKKLEKMLPYLQLSDGEADKSN